jgi:hypothetical protein
MAARIAWLLNLDADRELQDPAAYRATDLSDAQRRELIARVADLIAPDDVVLDADAVAPLSSTDLTVQAFCPTPSALRRIAALGFPLPLAPPLPTLRMVNDRAFCAALGHGLPGSCFARDMPALLAHLQRPSPTTRYVIKRAFSFAGREQRRVQDGVLDDSTRGFCQHSFARGEGLQVEPWVERIADFSQHGYLTRKGELLTAPPREQRCDPMGRFLGMVEHAAQLTDAEAEQLGTALRETAAALTSAGYFGPFGIDAFRYRRSNTSNEAPRTAFNPRCEINARLTMGYPRALLLQGLARE